MGSAMTKRKKTCLIIAAPFVAVIAFYLLAVLVRVYAVPLYVNTTYGHSVATEFAANFNSVNAQLKPLGFDLPMVKATCYNHVTDGGSNGYFHHFSETVPCTAESDSQSFAPTASFKTQWQDNAPKLSALLKSGGWIEGGNFESNTKLLVLYTNYDPVYSKQSAYSKTDGKFSCDLVFEYANYSGTPSNANNTKADVRETCTRNVAFFGGSSG
jgi:hypothetical protein